MFFQLQSRTVYRIIFSLTRIVKYLDIFTNMSSILLANFEEEQLKYHISQIYASQKCHLISSVSMDHPDGCTLRLIHQFYLQLVHYRLVKEENYSKPSR